MQSKLADALIDTCMKLKIVKINKGEDTVDGIEGKYHKNVIRDKIFVLYKHQWKKPQ